MSTNRFANRQAGNTNRQSRALAVDSWRAQAPLAPDANLPAPIPKDRYYIQTQRVKYGGIPRHAARGRFAEYGNGTIEDPLIEWLCEETDRNKRLGYADRQTEAARHVAKLGGFRYVMIRAVAHDTMMAYEADGKKSTFATNGGSRLQKTDPSDFHITVEMGEGPDKVQIHGHIFLNGKKHPTAPYSLMTEPVTSSSKEGRRRYPGASGDRTSSYEFWIHAGVRVYNLPNQ